MNPPTGRRPLCTSVPWICFTGLFVRMQKFYHLWWNACENCCIDHVLHISSLSEASVRLQMYQQMSWLARACLTYTIWAFSPRSRSDGIDTVREGEIHYWLQTSNIRIIILLMIVCIWTGQKITTRLRAKCDCILYTEDGRSHFFSIFSFPRKKRYYHSPKLNKTEICLWNILFVCRC